MRSTSSDSRSNRSPNSSPETAVRIRSAAIETFAERGFAKSTIRAIAAAADVSPGLVIHHFGSKDGLRRACDDFVFSAIADAKAANADYATEAVREIFASSDMSLNIDYLTKSLLDPSDHGQRYFDHYVDLVEGYIRHGFAGYEFRTSDTDVRGQAATIAALALAPSILGSRLQMALGTADFPETMSRLAPHLYDLYFHGVITAAPDTASANSVASDRTETPTAHRTDEGDEKR